MPKFVRVPAHFLDAMDTAPYSLDMKYQAQKLLEWWRLEKLRMASVKTAQKKVRIDAH